MAFDAGNIRVYPQIVKWGTLDLGLLKGDLNPKFQKNIVEVTAHQTGSNVIGGIITGSSYELPVVLEETDMAKLLALFGVSDFVGTAGGMTPGTETIMGLGNFKQFQNVLADCKALKLHPQAKAVDDLSEDLTFWLAYPIPSSLKFSGENPTEAGITFKIYPDLSKHSEYQFGVYGDSTLGDFTVAGVPAS